MIINTILAMLFPARCIVCGALGTELCLPCLRQCPAAERECAEWVFPLYDYRHGGVKNAVRLFKYKGRRGLARVFAEGL